MCKCVKRCLLCQYFYIRRATRGEFGGIPPEKVKTLRSNFDICRNFQRIEMKFCIVTRWFLFWQLHDQICNSMSGQPIELERCSHPLNLASRLVQIKKKFVLGSQWVTLQMGMFSHFWPSLPGPGRQPKGPFLWLKSLWKLSYNPRFQSLDWFSSVTGTKIMAQKSNFQQK